MNTKVYLNAVRQNEEFIGKMWSKIKTIHGHNSHFGWKRVREKKNKA